jgi:hypothetical protein
MSAEMFSTPVNVPGHAKGGQGGVHPECEARKPILDPVLRASVTSPAVA